MPGFEELRSSALFTLLLENPQWVGLAVFVIAFVESFAIAGVVVPGVALLAAAAFIAGGGALDLGPALACAWAGAVLGDGSSFLIGRWFGPALRRQSWLQKRPHWIEAGDRFFERHGVLGVVLGRFVGPIRPVVPLIAGMLRMRMTTFFAINLTSAFAWAPVYVLPGYLLGASMANALQPPVGWLAGVVLILFGVGGAARLTAIAWRAGLIDGRLGARLDPSTHAGAWLRGSLTADSRDTRLAAVAATLTLSALLLLAALILMLPMLADWRRFLQELLGIAWRLF